MQHDRQPSSGRRPPPALPRATAAVRRRTVLAAGITGLLLAASRVRAQQPAPPAYRVVVNARNPLSSVDRRFLSQAMLKKVTHWDHGEPIRPVDQGADSPTRRRFSSDVHNRSVAAIRNYWQQVIFSGRGVPPPELENDEAVVRFVARHPGAVGYVSGAADVAMVKVLLVR
jgi:hypothetical protein